MVAGVVPRLLLSSGVDEQHVGSSRDHGIQSWQRNEGVDFRPMAGLVIDNLSG